MWLVLIITRILHAKYDLNRTQEIEVIKVSLYVTNVYCPKEALY